jgi:serine/threonine-protein kinase
VVDALAAAHDSGIVHRDLKPANIFLVSEQRRTQPKIVDFGIAKMNQGALGAGAAPSITRHGEVVGSPGYMSPEQARGLSRIGGAADIWAVCVVLYECIVGRQPFVGENYNAWLRSIIEDAASPTTDFGAGDEALWKILEKGLEKEPEDRWGSMRAFGAELAQWLLDRGVELDVCGDPVQQFLESPEKPAVLGVSGRRRLVSVHAGVASEAHTLKAAESSRPRFYDDEASYRESASPLTHTKRPEVTARMTRGVIALTAITVVAALAGVIAAFSVGAARNQDGVEQHGTRPAAVGAAPPSTPSRRAAAIESDPSAPLPPAITVESTADEPPPAVQQPSPAPSPSKRDAHRPVAEKVPAAHPSASKPAVHSPAAPAGELKDPY